MHTNDQVTLIALIQTELHRLKLDQPGLVGLFELEKIDRIAYPILTTERNAPVEFSENSTEEAKRAVFRAINSEIYQALRQADNSPLISWLRAYLLDRLHRISHDTAYFEDAVQEGLSSIFLKLNTLNHPESFLIWSLQIVRNAFINYYRKKATNVKIELPLYIECDTEMPDSVEASLCQELREILLHHINNLRPTKNTKIQQFILVKFYFEDWPIEEIARELKITNQKVSHLLDEAHKRLRNDAQLKKKISA